MIHWMISRVTSALCFQRFPISFSKTKLKQRSVVTLRADPRVCCELNLQPTQPHSLPLFYSFPEHNAAVCGVTSSARLKQTRFLIAEAAAIKHSLWRLSSAACRSSSALPHLRWEKDQSCSEMNPISVVTRLLSPAVCAVIGSGGFSSPHVCSNIHCSITASRGTLFLHTWLLLFYKWLLSSNQTLWNKSFGQKCLHCDFSWKYTHFQM